MAWETCTRGWDKLELVESSRFPPWALLTERTAPLFRMLAPKTESFVERAETPNVSLKIIILIINNF